MRKLFVAGIDTNVGKTVVSAILVEALSADYWKPIQSGDLHNSDTMKVRSLVRQSQVQFHPEVYRFSTPMSPHVSAARDGMNIDMDEITLPPTTNDLIIEGAGGLLVPLNDHDLVIDLIKKLDAEVILVSRNYLGSINHTLLSAMAIEKYGIRVKGIVFNGEEIEGTEEIILKHTGYKLLGRISEEEEINRDVVGYYARQFVTTLYND